jgi:hypothetical protein
MNCEAAYMSEVVGADDRQRLERLGLDDWSEAASAQVVSVTVVGDRAEVALLINGDYEYWMYFQRDSPGWQETVTGNGPTPGWDDPGQIDWSTDA